MAGEGVESGKAAQGDRQSDFLIDRACHHMTFMAEFRDAFFEESADHVATVEQGLLALQNGSVDAEQMHAIFRSAHSLKGLASTLGFPEIASFTHDMEGVFDRLRSGTIEVTPELAALLLRSNDTLRGLLAASHLGEVPSLDTCEVTAALRAVHESPVTHSKPVQPDDATTCAEPLVWSVRLLPRTGIFGTGQDPLLIVRALSELGGDVCVVCDTTRLPLLDSLNPHECHLIWIVKVTTTASRDTIARALHVASNECEYSIRDITADPARAGVAAGVPVLNEPSGDKPPAETSVASIRVPTEKVDALTDLVGELASSQAMVKQLASAFDMSRLSELQDALASLDRNIRDLRNRVATLRVLPVATVFNRFHRMVHDASTKLGKKVRLEMYGAETELDTSIIERIGDPLTHLVRNAIDHGLETPDHRLAAGKGDTGTVALRAVHEGGSVVIEVTDDGRGLDTRRIREKAEANGLIRPDDVLDDDAIHQFIFVPGLSTVSQVSDLSGRGVGMDVVRRNVAGLGGSVALTSVPGHGSRIRIRLPLTLAMLDGAIAGAGGHAGGLSRDGGTPVTRDRGFRHDTGVHPSMIQRS